MSFPILTTPRLILNQLSLDDVPLVTKYASNKKIADTTSHIPHPYSDSDATDWINHTIRAFVANKAFSFAIRLKERKEFIGAIGVHVHSKDNKGEFGYWLAEPFWNKGIITEAAGRLIRFCFEDLKLNKVFATHMVHNPASGKVMINNHMILEGEFKEHYQKNGEFVDVRQYRLTQMEYNLIKSK